MRLNALLDVLAKDARPSSDVRTSMIFGGEWYFVVDKNTLKLVSRWATINKTLILTPNPLKLVSRWATIERTKNHHPINSPYQPTSFQHTFSTHTINLLYQPLITTPSLTPLTIIVPVPVSCVCVAPS